MARVRIDAGGSTFMPICECGWRGLPEDDRTTARQAGRRHELGTHPGEKDALRAYNNQRHRDASR